MSEVLPAARSKFTFTVAALVLVAGVMFLLALLQHESGRYFTKTLPLGGALAKAKHSGQLGYGVTLPKEYRDDLRVVEQAVVLEDGVPLPLRIEKVEHVGEKGHGRYRVTPRVVHLSAPDNSDPRSNGRSYELRVPREVHPRALWLPLLVLAGGMFYLQRHGVRALPRGRRPRLRPWVEPALVLGGSFAAMLWSLGHFADYTDGWLVVKGGPFSDGIAWLELAKSLSEGRGFCGPFEAHRGGYPLLLGGFFALAGGGSLVLAKLFNAIMLALGATAVYFIARRAFGVGIAVLALCGLILGRRFGSLVEMTLTEPIGFALAAIGLHQLLRACLRPGPWRFAMAGIFLALSNLVRPFTLLALPLFGGVMLWLAWRQRWGLRRFSQLGAAYVGGALLVFGPWVLRQKLAWGVATLDLNSALMLYGAAAPPGDGEKQVLSLRHHVEGDRAGFSRGDRGQLYRFYMGRYREVVGADPTGYLGAVAGQFVEFFSLRGFRDGHLREALGAVFFVALVWLAWRRRLAPLVLLAGLWPALAGGLAALPPWLVVVGSVVLGFVFHRGAGRLAIALLAATLFGAGVLNAMVGNFALNRGAVFIEWMVFLLVSAGISGLARLAAGARLEGSSVGEGEAAGGVDAIADRGALAVLAVSVLGLLALGAKAMFAAKPDPADWEVPAAVAAGARAEVSRRTPGIGGGDDLMVSRVRLGDYRWFIRAGEDAGHWARPFEVRPFDRTVAMPLGGYAASTLESELLTVNIPGDLRDTDGEEDFLLVGLRNIDEDAPLGHGTLIVETLALIPYDAAAGVPDLAAAQYFAPPPDLAESPGRR